MTTRFIRANTLRFVIGAVMVAVVYSTLNIYAAYQRDQRTARALDAQYVFVTIAYTGPEFVPQSLREKIPFFNRVIAAKTQAMRLSPEVGRELSSLTCLRVLTLRGSQITDKLLANLNGLKTLHRLRLNHSPITDAGLRQFDGFTELQSLELASTQVTDASMELLKANTSLVSLDLTDTKITDTGLEHLKGLANLKYLSVVRTRTTREGRAMLQKALPNCEIQWER